MSDLHDVLALQADIARAIAEQVRIVLTPQEQRTLTTARPVNPEAHEAYLKGRLYTHSLTTEGMKKAIGYFEKAIQVDPTYAPAYAGLAINYAWAGLGILPLRPSDVYPKARQAAERALKIDDTLADAHDALAYVALNYEWDWKGAEKGFQRALQLNPNLVIAHETYAHYLGSMCRFSEAAAEFKRAYELDPLSPVVATELAWPEMRLGRTQSAIAQLHKALELDENFPLAHYNLGMVYTGMGRYDEAFKEYQVALAADENNQMFLMMLGNAYALAGQRNKAARILANLLSRSKKEYISQCFISRLYVSLGDKENAMGALLKAYKEHDQQMIGLRMTSPSDPLYPDPRFQNILRQMNFPP